jgi:hypothetical protein
MSSVDNIEKIAQLTVGVLAVIALIYFSYIELLNPDLAISDRSFWMLVLLAGSALALKELQYFVTGGRQRQNGYYRRDTDDDTDNRRGNS